MERYQLILAYDGTHFAGFQRQAKARTVQGEVEKALRRLGWVESSLLTAGRTDTGVHAEGQVVSFKLAWKHSLDELLSALNAYLPLDVAAHRVKIVPEKFHPRYSALARRYRYQLISYPVRSPLLERYAWRISSPVSMELLQTCADLFLGTHDFAGFGKPPRPQSSTIRSVYQSEWKSLGNQFIYTITANAFLYHMVRRIIYIQVLVAQERVEYSAVQRSLEEGIELPFPGIAPAHGLVLEEIYYPE